MKPSEQKKLVTGMLSASEQTKFRICHQLKVGKYISLSNYCPSEEYDQFLQYVDKVDFEGAITYLHDTILPILKKRKKKLDYEIILSTISVALHSMGDIQPQQRLLIDDVITFGVIPFFLPKVKTQLRKGRYYIYKDDLLYMLQQLCQQGKLQLIPNQKEAIFYLLSQILAKRDLLSIYRDAMVNSIHYLHAKYGLLNTDDPRQMLLLQGKAKRSSFIQEWEAYVQPKKVERKPRTNLDDVARMLSEMDERHADEVHHLFMANYIDFSDYEFRDDWMMDAYHECFFAYFRSGENCINQLNNYVMEILKEWKQDSYHRYQKAKSDLIWWMTDPIPAFIPSLQHEIDDAVNSVGDTDDEEVVIQALMHFPLEIADIVKSGNYEDAAANLYYLFDYMAALEKKHDHWFRSLWSGGEMSEIARFLETLIELYCHLRQLKEVPESLKDEMDIYLRIFNRKTYFFGDMWGDSRFEDLLLDGKEQFNNYSVLEECSMWKYWYLKNYGNQSKQVFLN